MSTVRKPATYKPTDESYLWLVTQPTRPIFIGKLHLIRTTRGVSLHYAPEWLERGFPLSEDLPLIDAELMPTEAGIAIGAVDDARPDRWGERVIRFLDKPPRLSLLEYLYFAGADRFGALGVSTSADAYKPRVLGPLPALSDTDTIHKLIRKRGIASRGGALWISGAGAVTAASWRDARRQQRTRHARAVSSHGIQHPHRQYRRSREEPRTSPATLSSIGLSPACDVLPSGQALGFQQMRVVRRTDRPPLPAGAAAGIHGSVLSLPSPATRRVS